MSALENEGSTFGFYFKVRRAEIPTGASPPRGDRLADTDTQDEMRAQHGGVTHIEIVPDADGHNDITYPPLEHVPEASAEENEDEKTRHTADIDANVANETLGETGSGRRSSRATPARLVMVQEHTDSEQSSSQSPQISRSSRLLLVEDNIINQRILRRKLESKSFKVTTANNGREAVEAVQKFSTSESSACDKAELFDIILMDQEMPVMDGNVATKAIREMQRQGQVSHIPILGVTANVREEQKNVMRSAGMDDVISKPYGINELVERIRGLMIKREE